MKANRCFALASTSALAAGAAQGAVQYSGIVSNVFACPTTGSGAATGYLTDINGDGIPDFYLGFDGYNSPNQQKPFVAGYPTSPQYPDSAIIGRPDTYTDINGKVDTTWGFPVTPFGTSIGPGFQTPDPMISPNYGAGYFYKDGNLTTVGDWLNPARTEGYIGVELFTPTPDGTTNYGWMHMIYDSTVSPPTLTLVDYAYETGNLTPIVAGATNTLGAPVIYGAPSSQTVAVGSSVHFAVTAVADPAPTYRWMAGPVGRGIFTNLSNGGALSGCTTANLNINGATLANDLDYVVVVSNALGAATSSPPATLTVVAPVAQPTPQAIFAGLPARVSVAVASGLSPTFHWRQNGLNLKDDNNLQGTGSASLLIKNLVSTNTGNYDVVLTTGSLSVTSTVAQVTVLSTAGQGAYQAAMLASKPWAYYPLNETGSPAGGSLLAYDNAGAFNGVYGPDVANGAGGTAGPRPSDGYPGFSPANEAAGFATGDPNSQITLAPWLLNTNTATFAAWVNPNGDQSFYSAVLYSGTTNGSQAGLAYYWQDFPNGSTSVDVNFSWGQDGNEGGVGLVWDSGVRPPPSLWSLVAATVTSSNIIIYNFSTNGLQTGVLDNSSYVIANYYPAGFTNAPMAFNLPALIGSDPRYLDGSRNFSGAIDEVAVWNRALSQGDLQTLYNAAAGIVTSASIALVPVGSNLQLTWSGGDLLESSSLAGPWTTNLSAVSPYTVAPTNAHRFYRVGLPGN